MQYNGGKKMLAPKIVSAMLNDLNLVKTPAVIYEPFAGGGGGNRTAC